MDGCSPRRFHLLVRRQRPDVRLFSGGHHSEVRDPVQQGSLTRLDAGEREWGDDFRTGCDVSVTRNLLRNLQEKRVEFRLVQILE